MTYILKILVVIGGMPFVYDHAGTMTTTKEQCDRAAAGMSGVNWKVTCEQEVLNITACGTTITVPSSTSTGTWQPR